MECLACEALFDIGRACNCTSSSLPAAVAAPDSHPDGVAGGGGLSSEPAPRRRGGIQTGELLSTNDVAMKTAGVARSARSIFRKIGAIDHEAMPIAEGCPSPAVTEISKRRTQLIALDTELKALRLAGAQAEIREQDDRLDRLERAVAQMKAGDLKREEVAN